MARLQVDIDGPKVAEGAKNPAADREANAEEDRPGNGHRQMERTFDGEDFHDTAEAETQEHDREGDGRPMGPAGGDVPVISPDFDSALQQANGGEGEKGISIHARRFRICNLGFWIE